MSYAAMDLEDHQRSYKIVKSELYLWISSGLPKQWAYMPILFQNYRFYLMKQMMKQMSFQFFYIIYITKPNTWT